jgi:hypothetical protein
MELQLGANPQPVFNLRKQLWGRLSGRQVMMYFAACAFPIHVWAILMVLRDVSWVSGRTSAWDGAGLIAYALVFALVESLVVFAGFYLLSWLAPWRWSGNALLVRMTVFVWIFQIWAVLGQLGPLLQAGLPAPAVQLLANFSHPLRLLYAITAAMAALSLVIPILLLDRSPKLEGGLLNLLERVVTLMTIYLFLDLGSIAILVIRNT